MVTDQEIQAALQKAYEESVASERRARLTVIEGGKRD